MNVEIIIQQKNNILQFTALKSRIGQLFVLLADL